MVKKTANWSRPPGFRGATKPTEQALKKAKLRELELRIQKKKKVPQPANKNHPVR
jgi:hypothetical protein